MTGAPALPAVLYGWSGLCLAYASVAVPMLAALSRGQAPVAQWLKATVLALPLTLVAGVGSSTLTPLLHAVGLASGGMVHVVLSTAVSVALGYVSGAIMRTSNGSESVHQRGSLVADAPPRGSTRDQAALAVSAGIALAGIPVPSADETKHFKFVGTTGTGKSTAIQEILTGALRRGDRAVIADPDGGYLNRYYDAARGDVILNPFEAGAVKWDLFGEIDNAYDVEQLARSLIPDNGGSDRSWSSYARTFFIAVTRQAHAAGVEDVAELYRLLVSAETTELRTLVKGTPAQPFLEEHNGRMFDSIRSVTSSAVGALEYVGQQQAPSFSVRRWVAGGKSNDQRGVLFIPYQAGQIAALRSTISAWMRLAIFAAMDREEGDQRLWFVVDELDALGQIDGLKDALARLRKFGGRCVLGFQSVGQVSSTYGMGEAQTIIENCGNTLILRCSGSQQGGTASFASRLIGQREVIRTTESRARRSPDWRESVTRSEHLGIEPAVMDSEIEQLPDRTGFLKLSSSPIWLRVSLPVPKSSPSRRLPREMVTPPHPASSNDQQLRSQARAAWQLQRAAPDPSQPLPRPVPVARAPGAARSHGAKGRSSNKRIKCVSRTGHVNQAARGRADEV